MASLEAEREERPRVCVPGVVSVFVWVQGLDESITPLMAKGTKFYSTLTFAGG